MIPVAGSAYTYGYATLGEFIAWIIGWDLILEYAFGAATVASGWSEYFNRVLDCVRYADSRINGVTLLSRRWAGCGRSRHHQYSGLFILLLLSALLIKGTQESALVNGFIVVPKVAIVLMVICIGWGFMNPANHTPFIPVPRPM